MKPVRRLYVVTHRDPAVAGQAIRVLTRAAQRVGIELYADEGEQEKYPELFDEQKRGQNEQIIQVGKPLDCDAAMVLAGDGTLLRTLSRLGPSIPTLGVNFGMLGFLSGAAHTELAEAVEALANGDYRTANIPGLEVDLGDKGTIRALNDVVAAGGVTGRVNEVGWSILSQNGAVHDVMGTVACDGMVISSPIGSTAYNLSIGGPVMAWGVAGTVVSFIAPHTLASRPLVVAPEDEIIVQHMGRGAALKVMADGTKMGHLKPGDELRVRRGTHQATIALFDQTSFYARYRDSFAVPMHFTGPRVRASELERSASS